MPNVTMQFSENSDEYRLLIDGDEESSDFVPYGTPSIVEMEDGTVYWTLASKEEAGTKDPAEIEWEVYCGRKVENVQYEDVVINEESGEEEVDETETAS